MVVGGRIHFWSDALGHNLSSWLQPTRLSFSSPTLFPSQRFPTRESLSCCRISWETRAARRAGVPEEIALVVSDRIRAMNKSFSSYLDFDKKKKKRKVSSLLLFYLFAIYYILLTWITWITMTTIINELKMHIYIALKYSFNKIINKNNVT